MKQYKFIRVIVILECTCGDKETCSFNEENEKTCSCVANHIKDNKKVCKGK